MSLLHIRVAAAAWGVTPERVGGAFPPPIKFPAEFRAGLRPGWESLLDWEPAAVTAEHWESAGVKVLPGAGKSYEPPRYEAWPPRL